MCKVPQDKNFVKGLKSGVDSPGVAVPAIQSPHEPSTNSSEKANGKMWREPETSSKSTFAKAPADILPAEPTPNPLSQNGFPNTKPKPSFFFLLLLPVSLSLVFLLSFIVTSVHAQNWLFGSDASGNFEIKQRVGATTPTVTPVFKVTSAGVISNAKIPASQVSLGTFDAGNFTFQNNLLVSGNVGIGTTGPGAALEVKGTNSLATLGTELVTNGTFVSDLSSWTTTANWSWSAGTALHAIGNTDTIYQNISVTNGTTYQIEVTIAGRTAGSFGVTIGSVPVYQYGTTNLYTVGTHKKSFVASGTGSQALTFTPTSDFDGSIDNVTVKPVTALATAIAKITDSDGRLVADVLGTQDEVNLGIGYQSLQYITTGYANSAFGRYALSSNTTGAGNTAFGIDTLKLATYAVSNTAMGAYALDALTTAPNNTAVGYAALTSLTTGINNVAVGVNALATAVSDGPNTAVGYAAQYLGNGATSNSSLGYYSLANNVTGDNNTAVGMNAGLGTVSNSFSNNTLIGYATGYLLTTGSNNTFLGYQAGNALTTGANNIIIGYDIDLPAVSSSNMLDIGNLIYATGLTSTGTTISTGNVGIGTTGPGVKLDIFNTDAIGAANYEKIVSRITEADSGGDMWGGQAAGMAFHIYAANSNIDAGAIYGKQMSGTVTNGGLTFHTNSGSGLAEVMRIDNAGNVGIGTTGPAYKLDVAGGGTDTDIQVNNTTTTGFSELVLKNNTPTYGFMFYNGSAQANYGGNSSLNIYNSASAPIVFFTNGNNERMRIDGTNGNVGIGTTGPGAKLNVASAYTNGTGFGIQSNLTQTVSSNGSYYDIGLTTYPKAIISNTITNSGYLMALDAGNLRSDVNDIGTLSALYGERIQFGHYSGTATARTTTNAYGIRIEPYAMNGTISNLYGIFLEGVTTGGTLTNNFGLYQNDANAKNYFAGNVGIGTTGPDGKVEIAAGLSSQIGLKLNNNDWYEIYFNGNGSAGSNIFSTDDLQITTANTKKMYFVTDGAITATIGGGNVGIGTTGPGAKLDIKATTGNGIVTQSIGPGSAGVYGSNDYSGYGVYATNSSIGYGVYATNSNVGYALYCSATAANKCGGNQAWYNASDRRLKENIKPVNNALAKVLNLEGVIYNLKSDSLKTLQMGFIAQDVLPYVPEVVSYDKENDSWGMQTSQLTALLTEAVKEQQQQFDSLKAQVAAQQLQIDSLKQEMEEMRRNNETQ